MLNPGDLLLNGKYRIVRLVGQGGFGFVYLADETMLNEQVAIKELVPAMVGNEDMLKRFLAEARATRRLTHERLVRTYDVFRDGTNYYIAMEYMTGGSLQDRLQAQGQMLPGEAAQMAADVAEGLDYAHQRGVVHCDLKPGNILFDAQGRAKVGDFGIAHISDRLVDRTWYTSLGFVAGTVAYMSPEQAAGVRDDPRIDIYALGAVLYRTLTSRSYFQFDERVTPVAQAENVTRLRTSPVPPPSTYDRRIPAWLDAIVLKALAKQADDRFATAAEFRNALLRRQLQPADLSPAPPPGRVAPPASKPEPEARPGHARPPAPKPAPAAQPGRAPARTPAPRWLWILVAAAVFLCVVLAALIATALDGGGTEEPPVTLVVVLPDTPTFEAPTVPAATATIPPAPSPTPAPPSVPPAGTLYVDNFQDPSSGWDSYDMESAAAGYEGGEYRIAVYQTNWIAWANPSPLDLENYQVEIDIRAVDGPVDNSFGLIVRYQPDTMDYYWFKASSDGYYAVDLFTNRETVSLLEWQPSTAIVQGLGETNRLQVVCNGGQYTFYINGVYLADVWDDTLQGGSIGVAAGSFDEPGVVIHFDQVAVTTLNP